MKNSVNLHYFLIIIFVFLIACNKDKLLVDQPTYISVDSFTVSNSCYPEVNNRPPLVTHKVSDIWVYVDGNLQGTYELPAKFPVLSSGIKSLEIRPGIVKNGINSLRAIYPFYEFYKTSIDFQPNTTVQIDPCLAYINEGIINGELEVAWQETFEGVINLDYNKNTDTVVVPVSSEGDFVEGFFSGGIFLGPNDYFFELISPTLTNLPTNGTPIYLELNYRTNHDFFVGLYLRNFTEQINLYGFRANDSWNKVYIDLSEPIRYNGNSPNFNIFIGFQKDAEIENVRMFIDNIKLLHF